VRLADHDRESSNVIAQGPNWAADPFNPAKFPQGYTNYPGDYGTGIGGNFPRDVWYYTAEQMAAWNAAQANRDPVGRRYPFYDFSLQEKTRAAYRPGQPGRRALERQRRRAPGQDQPGSVPVSWKVRTASTPGAITGSAFGNLLAVH
jgi:iron complex outermembrane receptor protein